MIKNLLFSFALFFSMAIYAQEESKGAKQFLEEIDQSIPQLLTDFSIPGAAIAIIEDGEIVLQKGYGFADIAKGTKINTKTGFNVGSISKTLAAWGVMKLVQEGKIELDVPASTYLTRWQLPESAFDSDGVTVRRLLSHTAGLSLHSVSAGPPYDHLPTLEEWLIGKNDGLGPVEIVQEPGSGYKYSGGGYGVLQLIIEEVSGKSFEEYMQAQVLDPLGMRNSSYRIDDKIMVASATPYDKYGEETDFELFTVQAGAGLHTTLEDFARFAIANLYDHKDIASHNPVLAPDMLQQMMQPALETGGRFLRGLGYLTTHIGPSRVFVGHGGSNEGWQANFTVDPSSNDGFVVLTNSGAGYAICNLLFCGWINWKSGELPWKPCQDKIPIATKLKQIIDKNGIAELPAAYTELKKDQPNAYGFSEGQLNQLGYYYMGKGDLSTAKVVLKINVDAFPYAFNVYDSYGEVLLAQGNREEAIENYKRSIELNPSNDHGFQVLAGLGISREDLIVWVPAEHLRLLAGEYVNDKNAEWRIIFKEADGTLSGQDKDMHFSLTAFGNNAFLKEDTGSTLIFDCRDQTAITLTIKSQLYFKKVE